EGRGDGDDRDDPRGAAKDTGGGEPLAERAMNRGDVCHGRSGADGGDPRAAPTQGGQRRWETPGKRATLRWGSGGDLRLQQRRRVAHVAAHRVGGTVGVPRRDGLENPFVLAQRDT